MQLAIADKYKNILLVRVVCALDLGRHMEPLSCSIDAAAFTLPDKGRSVRKLTRLGFAYWTEQWSESARMWSQLAFTEAAGRILVDVHQVVRDLAGAVLADEHVEYRFTLEHGLIRRMEVGPLPSSG
jgi:hypothetical protein